MEKVDQTEVHKGKSIKRIGAVGLMYLALCDIVMLVLGAGLGPNVSSWAEMGRHIPAIATMFALWMMFVCVQVIVTGHYMARYMETLLTPRAAPGFERIIRDSAVMNGQAIIKGTRLTVQRVLFSLARYPNREELAKDYPQLTDDDIRQALAYAASSQGPLFDPCPLTPDP